MAEATDTARARHVLVVDDNVELAQTFQELLELHGYRVTISNDGVQALKCIQQAELDAIICDMSMPQLEGDMFYYAAQRIRPELAGRFIFVTGHAGNPRYEPFLKETGVAVLYKPLLMEDLLAALAGQIARAPNRTPATGTNTTPT